MKDTIIVTSIYEEFWGTDEFYRSCKRLNLPVHNAFTGKGFTGNGDAMYMIYEAYKKLQGEYKYAVYSDGADSFFIKDFEVPHETIIYSAEKACYPIEAMAPRYPQTPYPWKYLNGGGCCGPIYLLIEFYENYGLTKYKGCNINGQKELAEAYLLGIEDDFPIKLDNQCEIFQTTAFADPGDFYSDGIYFENLKTGTRPCILHGNGRTRMEWLYKNLNR